MLSYTILLYVLYRLYISLFLQIVLILYCNVLIILIFFATAVCDNTSISINMQHTHAEDERPAEIHIWTSQANSSTISFQSILLWIFSSCMNKPPLNSQASCRTTRVQETRAAPPACCGNTPYLAERKTDKARKGGREGGMGPLHLSTQSSGG